MDNEKDNTNSNSTRLPGRMWNFLYVKNNKLSK